MEQPRWLEYRPLDDIESALVNPKGHADALIGESIGRFGFIETPVVDERTGRLVGGHGRRDQLVRLREQGADPPEGVVVDEGVWLVPVLRGWRSKDDDDATAAGIAINRIGEAGGWKVEMLHPILARFGDQAGGLMGVGFNRDDLSRIAGELEAMRRAPVTSDGGPRPHAITVPEPGTERSERGDVWLLGEHRIMCGDCRDASDVALLLRDDVINVAFTSPPYAQQRNYDDGSGFVPIPPEHYVEWFQAVQANVAAYLAEDGSWFVNIKPTVTDDMLGTQLYVFDLVLAHERSWGWRFATEFCWERIGVPKHVTRRFKNQYEPIYQFARGPWKMRPEAVRFPSDNVPIPAGPGIGATTWSGHQGIEGSVRFGEQNRDVHYDYLDGDSQSAKLRETQGGRGPFIVPRAIDGDDGDGNYTEAGLAYPGNRLPTFAGSHDAVGHAAAFPVGLPAWFVRAYSDRGDVIYDPFVGSGSTVLACADEGRAGRGMELSGRYVDVACARWQDRTGGRPIHAVTGEAVDFLTKEAVQP